MDMYSDDDEISICSYSKTIWGSMHGILPVTKSMLYDVSGASSDSGDRSGSAILIEVVVLVRLLVFNNTVSQNVKLPQDSNEPDMDSVAAN